MPYITHTKITRATYAHIAGNYLTWTDEYGNTQVRFFRAGALEWANLIACTAELKLRGTTYVLRNTAKYQEAA